MRAHAPRYGFGGHEPWSYWRVTKMYTRSFRIVFLCCSRSRKADARGYTCCVPNCYNNSREDKHLKFYAFPKVLSHRRVWINAIRRPHSWVPKRSHKVCSSHFVNGEKSGVILHPTIFPISSAKRAKPNNKVSHKDHFSNVPLKQS